GDAGEDPLAPRPAVLDGGWVAGLQPLALTRSRPPSDLPAVRRGLAPVGRVVYAAALRGQPGPSRGGPKLPPRARRRGEPGRLRAPELGPRARRLYRVPRPDTARRAGQSPPPPPPRRRLPLDRRRRRLRPPFRLHVTATAGG